MRKIATLFALILCFTAFGQDREEASVRLFEKGQTMSFLLEDDTFSCSMWFFPGVSQIFDKPTVLMEMRDFEKSSEVKSIEFKAVVDGSTIKLYKQDGTYYGHTLFHHDWVFLYDTKGEFLFKLPRWYPNSKR